MRTEPPVSDPIASAARPDATETAAPEDDPPGASGSEPENGFAGVPKVGLRPRPEKANSDWLVLPGMTQPARTPRATSGQSRSGTRSRSRSEPWDVGMPAVS